MQYPLLRQEAYKAPRKRFQHLLQHPFDFSNAVYKCWKTLNTWWANGFNICFDLFSLFIALRALFAVLGVDSEDVRTDGDSWSRSLYWDCVESSEFWVRLSLVFPTCITGLKNCSFSKNTHVDLYFSLVAWPNFQALVFATSRPSCVRSPAIFDLIWFLLNFNISWSSVYAASLLSRLWYSFSNTSHRQWRFSNSSIKRETSCLFPLFRLFWLFFSAAVFLLARCGKISVLGRT